MRQATRGVSEGENSTSGAGCGRLCWTIRPSHDGIHDGIDEQPPSNAAVPSIASSGRNLVMRMRVSRERCHEAAAGSASSLSWMIARSGCCGSALASASL